MGLAALSATAPRERLAADALDHDDADGDGLTDAQEVVQQTLPCRVDTDGDGYSDAEEVARGSCPFSSADVPLPSPWSLALTARGEMGKIHIVMLAYYTDGQVANKDFDFGLVTPDGVMVAVPESHLLATARYRIHPTLNGLGHVAVVEFEVNPGPIIQLQHLSFFATMSVYGQGSVCAAAVVDLFASGDIVLKSGSGYDTFSASRGTSGGAGTIYQPIPPTDGLPLDWTPGSICRQKTTPVGYENGVVLTRVVYADCSDGWDAYCSPTDCKSSVGDEYTTVDPAGLVGG